MHEEKKRKEKPKIKKEVRYKKGHDDAPCAMHTRSVNALDNKDNHQCKGIKESVVQNMSSDDKARRKE
jgi:hypothetical protein